MKRALNLLILAIGAVPALAFADVSSTSIQLPVNFTATIWTQFNNSFAGLSDYTTLIIGTILLLVVIGELIVMLRHPGK